MGCSKFIFLTVESQFHFISLSFHFMKIDVQWNDWKMKIIKILWLLFSFRECFFLFLCDFCRYSSLTMINLIAFIYFPLFHLYIFYWILSEANWRLEESFFTDMNKIFNKKIYLGNDYAHFGYDTCIYWWMCTHKIFSNLIPRNWEV
jgi:hypothetical protein